MKVEIAGRGADAELAAGDTLQWFMQPKGKPWRKYDLSVRLKKFSPSEGMTLEVAKDSTGRVTELFEHLEWTLAYTPIDAGTRVTGRIRGRTRNWRSRLFSRISPHILMNQVFYPDLITLAGMGAEKGIEFGPRAQ